MNQLLFQEAVELLRNGLINGLVKSGEQYLLILTKHGYGYEVHIEWADSLPEDFSFLEENHLLTWWNQFTGGWLL